MTKSCARRHPRPRPDPQEAAGQGARRRQRGEARRRSRSCRRCRGCPTRWRTRSTRRSHRPGWPHASTPPTVDADDRGRRATSGRRTPAGGRTGSPRAPTRSTTSRSCRWRPSCLAGAARGARRRHAARARSPAWPSRGGAGRVVGVDPTARPDRRGGRRGGGPGLRPRRRRAAAVRRPASFDAVVACLVFEHIDDVDDAIAEVARVLRPGGRFVFFLNHPLLQTPEQRLDRRPDARPARAVLAHRSLPGRGRDASRRWRRACSSPSSTARSAAT